MNEPIWCSFCEDRPAVGRMVVMRDQSRDQISEVVGRDAHACDLHGRAWTGVPVTSSEDDGDYLVLQYVHPDYIQVTERHAADFAAEKVCSVCGDPTDPLPMWMVDRVLKAHPHLVLGDDMQWEGICVKCASESSCPHCDDKDPSDADPEESGGSSTHPYCH